MIERRTFQGGIERRKGEKPGIRGYAAVFNKLSEPMWGMREQIAPGAFDGAIDDDVRALFNHNPDVVLGRTAASTLKIGADERGLWYEVDLPDTSIARDLMVSVDRGDIRESSFAFTVQPNGDTWEENDDGVIIRTIKNVKRLYDVSPVTYPAYPDATAEPRGFEDALDRMKSWREERSRASAQRQLMLAERIARL